jgi:hypothetical protein
MKRLLPTALLSAFAFISTAGAQIITPVSIVQSSGGSVNGSPAVIIDGVIPPEETPFDAGGLTVSWSGTDVSFTMDLGAVFNISNILYSVDNNDSYELDYSTNDLTFTKLFANGIDSGAVSAAAGGLDTEVSFDTPSIPVSTFEVNPTMNFSPVDARFLRVEAVAGDNLYGIGEVTPFGTPFSAVPEPATYGWMAVGFLGIAVLVQRRRVARVA